MRPILPALIALVSLASSTAQADSFVAVEGYVFNRATGKPVSNVTVVVEACGYAGLSKAASTATTDANGFYQMPLSADFTNFPSESRSMVAICSTTQGLKLGTTPVYLRMPVGILRRDFYLDISKKIHSCFAYNNPSVGQDYPSTCPPPAQ